LATVALAASRATAIACYLSNVTTHYHNGLPGATGKRFFQIATIVGDYIFRLEATLR